MDFIPKIKITKKCKTSKTAKTAASKLSLKSRKNFTSSQSYSQCTDLEYASGSYGSVSLPVPELHSVQDYDEHSKETVSILPDLILTENEQENSQVAATSHRHISTQDSQVTKNVFIDMKISHDEEVLTIDLASTPEDEEEDEKKVPHKERNNLPKLSLEKIKFLKLTETDITNEINNFKTNDSNVFETEVSLSELNCNKESSKLEQLNNIETNENSNRKLKTCETFTNSDAVINESTEKFGLDTNFASKLKVFSKPVPKKFTLLDTNTNDNSLQKSTDSIADENINSKETDVQNLQYKSQNDSVIDFQDFDENLVKSNKKSSKLSDQLSKTEESKAKTSSDIPISAKQDVSATTREAEPLVSESAFISEELPCPVCNKHAGKNRRAHMKSCAARNSVSTAQLIKAIELQEKQAAERRALGLPLVIQDNQKLFVKKKSASSVSWKSSGMELAVALSKSLKEAEEQEELRRAQELLGDQEAFGWEATPSQMEMVVNAIAPDPPTHSAATQLTLGTGTDGSVKLKRGANTARRGRGTVRSADQVSHPLLLRTTQEERERIITEKVAMLLVGDDNAKFTKVSDRIPKPSLSSKLNTLQSDSSELWSLAAVSPSIKRETFYVSKLMEFVSPSKHEPGIAQKHLSQIPGRVKTPVKSSSIPKTTDMSLCSFIDCTLKSSPQQSTSPDRRAISSYSITKPSISSKTIQFPSPAKDHFSHIAAVPPEQKIDRKEVDTLARDWAALLNSRTMSDINIYVKGEHLLRAHKLVIFVRCPSMLEDIARDLSPGSDRVREEMMLWSDTSRDAALAMLEFIYCDTTERATTLQQEDLEHLTQLAQRYEVTVLLQHLAMLSKIRLSLEIVTDSKNVTDNKKKLSSTSYLAKCNYLLPSPKNPQKKNKTNRSIELSSDKKSITSSGSCKTSKSISPDLFEDAGKNEADEIESATHFERPDIDYLVSMMEKSSQSQKSSSPQQSVLLRKSASPVNTLEVNTSESLNTFKTKRKYSNSMSHNNTPKKICKDASLCRKNLSSEFKNVSDKEDNEFLCTRNTEMSTSQLLDYLKNDSSNKYESQIVLNEETENYHNISPIVSNVWENFDDCGYEPLLPPRISEAKKSLATIPSSPVTIISISSGTVSQSTNKNSPDSLSSSQTLVKTPMKNNVLDDSTGVFDDVNLSALERAALEAYNKVISLDTSPPQFSCTPVNQRTLGNENTVTPLADYSIMESPVLQKELEKYGIRRLRRNQAKLILRHIYNELHPLVPCTPASGSRHNSIVRQNSFNKRGRMKATSRTGVNSHVSRVNRGRNFHNMSFSQPDLAQIDADFEGRGVFDTARNVSLSQPLAQEQRDNSSDSDSCESSSSGESDNNDENDAFELDNDTMDLVDGSRTMKIETSKELEQTMSHIIVSEPQFHHRLIMYEPVMLTEVRALLKKYGKRCDSKLLLDYLDEHGITFRAPRPPRRPKRGIPSPRSKKYSVSQRGTRGSRRKASQK